MLGFSPAFVMKIKFHWRISSFLFLSPTHGYPGAEKGNEGPVSLSEVHESVRVYCIQSANCRGQVPRAGWLSFLAVCLRRNLIYPCNTLSLFEYVTHSSILYCARAYEPCGLCCGDNSAGTTTITAGGRVIRRVRHDCKSQLFKETRLYFQFWMNERMNGVGIKKDENDTTERSPHMDA